MSSLKLPRLSCDDIVDWSTTVAVEVNPGQKFVFPMLTAKYQTFSVECNKVGSVPISGIRYVLVWVVTKCVSTLCARCLCATRGLKVTIFSAALRNLQPSDFADVQ